MKELHLICNAHLDPVWQWDWDAGITAALATFYSAAELCEEYDYIFCHNEALLYEYIENYDPELFERIKDLVKRGKWNIMGGWYVQPDCTVPSGEAFIRQIETGRKYFEEKFGVTPRVALNFDSFGHTQGLVQILKKCGYDGYIFCRPMPCNKEFPDMMMNWKGFDGSSVKAVRAEDDTIYCSMLGQAVSDIKRKMQPWKDREIAIALWGVGNHGGGASRKDLKDIENFKVEVANEVTVIHSTLEGFFDKINPTVEWDKALQPVFVKCYSSDAPLKRKYAELEKKLFNTEKICAVAALNGVFTPDKKVFDEAQKCMAAVQFHDVLSGTSIYEGSKSSIQRMEYAMELLDMQFAKAFFALTKKDVKAVDGDFPIYVYNANPYATDRLCEAEFFMDKHLWLNEEGWEVTVYKDGKEIPAQLIKECSNINFDRRKRIAIKAELAPLGLTRFDVRTRFGKRFRLNREPVYTFENNGVSVSFNKENGCLESYKINGKEYLNGYAFMPVMYDDNEDPWGWHMTKVGANYKQMPASIVARITEKGELFTALESVYTLGNSTVYIEYRVYKDYPYIDVKLRTTWNDEGKGLKLEIPVANIEKFISQTSYGTQVNEKEVEICSHKFCAMKDGNEYVSIFKNGAYGCSVEDDKLYVNVFNGSVYCSHPVEDLPIIDEKRFNRYIETGKHEYSFRLFVGQENELNNAAEEFVNEPYTLNVYPHGKGQNLIANPVEISDKEITLSVFRYIDDNTYMIRLYNGCKSAKNCTCKVGKSELKLEFAHYEFKTLIYKNGKLIEMELAF